MKHIVRTLAVFFLMGTALSLADTVYISDITKINMRSGMGTDYRIIAMLDTGQTVELLEQTDGWARIRVDGGKEGWVLSRMLTTQEPCARVLGRAQSQLKEAQEELVTLSEENARLKEENALLTDETTQNNQVASKLKQEYDSLKAESADFFTVKQKLEAAQRETERQKDIAESAESELKELRRDSNWRWFLSGAAVLLSGIILGSISRKKRSPTLLR